MFTNSWYQFHTKVGQDIDLHNLVLPELIGHEHLCERCEVTLCEALVDIAGGDDQVAGIFRVGHDASLVVEIVILAFNVHDANNGQTLGDLNTYMTVLCLVALDGIHEGAGLEHILNVTRVDVLHVFLQRVEFVLFQNSLDLFRAEESVGVLVGNIDAYLGAQLGGLVRFVERGHGEYQIDR